MPAGDYTSCNKCGKSIFGYGLCIECSKSSYNFGTSYDFYGNTNNTYVSPVLPPNPNDGTKTLATILTKQLKDDAKKHVQVLAKMMGEPPISDGEFEEFWSKYSESLSSMNKKEETLNDIYNEVVEPKHKATNVPRKTKLFTSTEESMDTRHYEMIDNFEKGNEECDYDIESDDIDEIIDELEQEANEITKSVTTSDDSVADTFDRLFNDQPLKRKTLVVNLYAGPGSGKSTTAAGIFFELKSRGINCELATEFVKDLVWEERHKAIDNQVYVFAKQHHRITRLLGEVDVIVTDSPLLLTLIYGKSGDDALKNLARCENEKFWSFNCFIKRNKDYNPKGRVQTYAEARNLDISIADMLDEEEIPYEVYFGNVEGKNKIVDKILRILGNK